VADSQFALHRQLRLSPHRPLLNIRFASAVHDPHCGDYAPWNSCGIQINLLQVAQQRRSAVIFIAE